MRILFIQWTFFNEVDSRSPALLNFVSFFSLDQVIFFFKKLIEKTVFLSWTLSFYGGQYLKILDNEKTKAWMVLAGGMLALVGIVFWWMMIGNGVNSLLKIKINKQSVIP